MKIISLKIKNFLALGDVEIKPGKITQITGQNGQGKSSILKALSFAVGGSNDPSLVKLGEDSAEVLVELSDSTTIRRRLNSEGRQSVSVEKDGMKAKSPQGLLDMLFDQSSFNPLELLNSQNRTEAILRSIEIPITPEILATSLAISESELPPLDYSSHGLKVIETAQKYFYMRRAEANKVSLDKKNRWETYQSDLPKDKEKPKDTRGELKKQKEIVYKMVDEQKTLHMKALNAHEAKRVAEINANKYLEEAKITEREIANLEMTLKILHERHKKYLEIANEKLLGVSLTLPDIGAINQTMAATQSDLNNINLQLKEWDTIDAQAAQIAMVNRHGDDYREANRVAQKLNTMVNTFPIMRRNLMASAEMPVAGLEYKDEVFTVNGVSVDNLSSSQAMKLAIAVARKLAKKSKIICVDGCEQMDPETFAEFVAETKDDGFAYFATKVGEPFSGSDTVITMHDGGVQ